MALATSISMDGLYVKSGYTTKKESSSSYMAFTLYCEAADGTEVTVRTGVLKDENGDYILMDKFINKTISIKGIVEYYNPSASSDDDEGEVTDGFYYQIKVVSTADLVITD